MASPGVLEPERVPCKSLLRIDFQITNLDRKPNGFNGRGDFSSKSTAPPLPPNARLGGVFQETHGSQKIEIGSRYMHSTLHEGEGGGLDLEE